MLKRDYAPKWFLRRFPVKTVNLGHNHQWKVSATYPHAEAKFLGQAVYQVRQTRNEQWRTDQPSPYTDVSWRD
jgi:hypothetical protein